MMRASVAEAVRYTPLICRIAAQNAGRVNAHALIHFSLETEPLSGYS
jgi:hypothetical protein